MTSFFQLWEQISGHDTNEPASKAMQVIRAGRDMRSDDDTLFWDEFSQLCANPEGMAELLNVDQSTVASWPSRIKEVMNKTEENDRVMGDKDIESKVMPTGDNGAFMTSRP